MSMLYGTTQFDILNDDVLLIERTYLNESTYVLLNRSGQNVSILDLKVQPEAILAGFLTTDGHLPALSAVAFTAQ